MGFHYDKVYYDVSSFHLSIMHGSSLQATKVLVRESGCLHCIYSLLSSKRFTVMCSFIYLSCTARSSILPVLYSSFQSCVRKQRRGVASLLRDFSAFCSMIGFVSALQCLPINTCLFTHSLPSSISIGEPVSVLPVGSVVQLV